MDDQRIKREMGIELSPGTVVDPMPVIETRKLLSALLKERVAARLLSEQDERILSLRMGLEDGYCCTLDETANLMYKSPETVRCRQHMALRKAIKDLRFFKTFKDYAR